MNTFKHTVLIFVTLLASCISAYTYADGQSVADDVSSQSHQHADPVANAEKHLSLLKTELKITPEQAHAWEVYSESTKIFAEKLGRKSDRVSHDKPLSADERFDRHVTLMKERLANFENMSGAFKLLYATLSPAQKEIADRHFERKYH